MSVFGSYPSALNPVMKMSLNERVRCIPGAPMDDFLLNTLKTLFRLSRVFSHPKRCDKICICSVIPGEFESF